MSLIALNTSLIICDMYGWEIRNEKDKEVSDSPVAKYLKATHNFCCAEIGLRTLLEGGNVMKSRMFSRIR